MHLKNDYTMVVSLVKLGATNKRRVKTKGAVKMLVNEDWLCKEI